MDPVSPLPAISCLFAAAITSFLIARKFGAPSSQGRHAPIDGLRGYLATLVFLHHSCIWYFYLRTGQWQIPPSNLYTHFGQTSVSFFFMITGFLFFSKLIDGRSRKIDWMALFVSRFLRLTPLYIVLIFLFFLLIAFLSHGVMKTPGPKLFVAMMQWLAFTIPGTPNLNGVGDPTLTVIAGVTWSLPYEWFFYFSLPLLALTTRATPPLLYIIISAIGVSGLVMWQPQARHLIPFMGGIAAAILSRVSVIRNLSENPVASLVAIACVATTMHQFPTAYETTPIILLSIAFSIIASGNSLFGILTNTASRNLGEFAYSIYLLHSIILFIVFTFILGTELSGSLSPLTHWLIIIGITPILIITCAMTFRYIEQPAMRSTTAVTGWIRSRRLLVSSRRSGEQHLP